MTRNKTIRLEFIEFLLRFRGWLTRKDVANHFDIGLASTSHDFKDYREKTAEPSIGGESTNFFNSDSRKGYEAKLDSFRPVFELNSDKALNFLRIESIKASNTNEEPAIDVPVNVPKRLGMPDIDILATVSRAISNRKGLNIEYFSGSSGESQRIIIPHSIGDTGLRWYVRAYCTRRNKFTDFVISRMKSAQEVNIIPDDSQTQKFDYQWNKVLTLEIVPHENPQNLPHKETVEFEAKMTDGPIKVDVKAAEAGYWLQLWNVDCSPNRCLKGKNYLYQLVNYSILQESENAFLAPGFTK